VYVNGQYVGMHEGGHTPFHFDITDGLTWDEEQVAVRVEDPSTDETIPRGKQFWLEKPDAIWYTPTTGIWQTVWLEAVSDARLERVKLQPDLDRGDMIAEFETTHAAAGATLEVEASFKGRTVVTDRIAIHEPYVKRAYHLMNRNIFRTSAHHDGWTWTPDNPNLFDVKLTLRMDGRAVGRRSRNVFRHAQDPHGTRHGVSEQQALLSEALALAVMAVIPTVSMPLAFGACRRKSRA